jgi:hypothetical protein
MGYEIGIRAEKRVGREEGGRGGKRRERERVGRGQERGRLTSIECVVMTTERSVDTSAITSHMCLLASGSIPLEGYIEMERNIYI